MMNNYYKFTTRQSQNVLISQIESFTYADNILFTSFTIRFFLLIFSMWLVRLAFSI